MTDSGSGDLSQPVDLYRPVAGQGFGPLSKRVGSLRIIFLVVAVLMVASSVAFLLLWAQEGAGFFDKDGLGRSLAGPVVALFGAGLAALLKLYDLSNERLGAIDTFLHEMIGICRLMYTTNLVGAFRALYFLPGVAAFGELDKSQDYTVSYDNNIKDLGFLGAKLSYVVTFYTMIKGARDGMDSFKLWPLLDKMQKERPTEFPPAFIMQRKEWDIIQLIYCLFLAFENAYYAVDILSENSAQKRLYQDFLMTLMSDCYVFLREAMPTWDRRSKWLANERRSAMFNERNEIYRQSQIYYQLAKAALKLAYPDHYREQGVLAAGGAGAPSGPGAA